MDKIMDFLNTSNARIDNGNKWLVVNEIDTCYEITVYEHNYYKRQPNVLYNGYNLDEALAYLK
jgi:hypothetical protein